MAPDWDIRVSKHGRKSLAVGRWTAHVVTVCTAQAISLILTNENVRIALVDALGRRFPACPVYLNSDNSIAGDVLLSTPAECSPVVAEHWVAGGRDVVILAPVPVEAQRRMYTRIGASYLPMDLESERLFDLVARLLNRSTRG